MTNLELAYNPNTPPETLVTLATDEDSCVRWGVAKNPNTPVETLEFLATDKNSYVRCCVAINPNVTEEILLMVKAKNYQVRKPLLQLAH